MKETRTQLLEAARELFVEKGIERTTMTAIAKRAGKGRRTLYAHFYSREQIYLELITMEMEHLNDELQKVMNLPVPADEKLRRYIFVRLDTFREIILRNGSMKAEFFQDAVAVERARRTMNTREIQMLRRIFQEGVAAGLFNISNTSFAAEIAFNMLKGLEKPYYRDKFYSQMQIYRNLVANALIKAISK